MKKENSTSRTAPRFFAICLLFFCARCAPQLEPDRSTSKRFEDLLSSREKRFLTSEGREELSNSFDDFASSSKAVSLIQRKMLRQLTDGNTHLAFYGSIQNHAKAGFATIAFLSLLQDRQSTLSKHYTVYLQIDPELRTEAIWLAQEREWFEHRYMHFVDSLESRQPISGEEWKLYARLKAVLDHFIRRPAELLLLAQAEQLDLRVEFIGQPTFDRAVGSSAQLAGYGYASGRRTADKWRQAWCDTHPFAQEEEALAHRDLILGRNLGTLYRGWVADSHVGRAPKEMVHVVFVDALHAAKASLSASETQTEESAVHTHLYAAHTICPTRDPQLETLASYAASTVVESPADRERMRSVLVESSAGEATEVAHYGLCLDPNGFDTDGSLIREDERLHPLFDCWPIKVLRTGASTKTGTSTNALFSAKKVPFQIH